eukprot:4517819-Prymnesium_polylepis.1
MVQTPKTVPARTTGAAMGPSVRLSPRTSPARLVMTERARRPIGPRTPGGPGAAPELRRWRSVQLRGPRNIASHLRKRWALSLDVIGR